MTRRWYAAHGILYLRYLDGNQDEYVVWENIYLIRVEEGENPFDKARAVAHLDEDDPNDPTDICTFNARPAQWTLAGIRKVIECQEEQLAHGTELTYNELRVASRADLERLARGEAAKVELGDERAPADRARNRTEGESTTD